MTVDEAAFSAARRRVGDVDMLGGSFARRVVEAYEAAKAEPAERPMRERIDNQIITWLMQRESMQRTGFTIERIGFDDLRNSILTELVTPTRAQEDAATAAMGWNADISREVVRSINTAVMLAAREGK